MVRVHNWDSRLVEFAMTMKGRKFQWGRTDCVALTRKGLIALYGRDPWKRSVPTWKGKVGALRMSVEFEGPKAADFLGTEAEELTPAFATSGTIALAPTRDEHGLPGLSILLPGQKVLISTPQTDVMIIDRFALPTGSRFYTYG